MKIQLKFASIIMISSLFGMTSFVQGQSDPTNDDWVNNGGDVVLPSGNVGIGTLAPATLLHVHNVAALPAQLTISNLSAPLGFRMSVLKPGNAEINHFDNRNILQRTSSGRMMMYGNNPPAGISQGLVRIGPNNGAESVTQDPKLLVVGSEFNTASEFGDYTVAEFRSDTTKGSSVGIKIRGSRNTRGYIHTAFVDYSNFDDNEGADGTELIMARTVADMQQASDMTGYYRIFTNRGGGQHNINQGLLIDKDQRTGLGPAFGFQTPTSAFLNPIRRLDVADGQNVPQMRSTYRYDAVYTDLFTNQSGNYVINPTNGRVGINLDGGSVGQNPTHTIDVNGNFRIRELDTVASPQSLLVGQQVTAGVPVDREIKRIDFTNNATDVLLGDGSFGAVPGVVGGADDDWWDVGATGSPVPSNTAAAYRSGNVAIGINTLDDSKFHVFNKTDLAAGRFETDGASLAPNVAIYGVSGLIKSLNPSTNYNLNHEVIGVRGRVHDVTLAGYKPKIIGVKGEINGCGAGYGVLSSVLNTYTATGFYTETNGKVMGSGITAIVTGRDVAIGGQFNVESDKDARGVWVRAEVQGSLANTTSKAGYFIAKGGSLYNTAIHAVAQSGGGATNLAGQFDGDVYVNGSGYISNGPWSGSDQKLKTDIKEIKEASSILAKLNPKSYYFKTDEYPAANFSDKKQFGLIAQELKAVLPELVKEITIPVKHSEDENEEDEKTTINAVSYTPLISILIQGHKEQQAQLESKDAEIAKLNERLDAIEECLAKVQLCETRTGRVVEKAEMDVTLSDLQTIVLDQNTPNPFREKTSISWILPETVVEAKIVFLNSMGAIIKEVVLEDRGAKSMNVYAYDLSAGTYSYSLIADGKLIETKKMVISK